MKAAHCGISNWKFWKKVANGRDDDWSKSSRKKPTAKAEFFPLSSRKARRRRKQSMGLRSVVGRVGLEVWHGQDPQDKHWGCPIRERWGLRAHQQMSPVLEEKLAFTVTLSSSYEAAAQVAGKWGSEVDDSVIHALVQRAGSKAEVQTQERLKQVPRESYPQRQGSELALLMVDGWFARFRGPGWGKKKTNKERVEWHEIKNGVFYLQEQAGRTEGGRGVLTSKTVVRSQGDSTDLGRRLHWEALRGGLGRAYKGMDEAKAKLWVEKRLHRLRHGREQRVLKEISRLKASRSQAGKMVQKEKNYFAGQAQRMNYKEIADRGWPIGSGPVESSCRHDQCRFKRPGQSWTRRGFGNLSAVDQARRNNHWDELWLSA